MPSIIINEKDLTRGGGSTENLNVVYIPGFTNTSVNTADDVWPVDDDKKINRSNAASAMTPTLCTTLDEFEMYFGKRPATWTENTKSMIDKSYIYAKELIGAGVPVLYESVNGLESEPNLLAMYKALVGDTFALQRTDGTKGLSDLGEYSFKYLTSGGYPSFGYGLSSDNETTFSSEEAENGSHKIAALTKLLADNKFIDFEQEVPSNITLNLNCTEVKDDGTAYFKISYLGQILKRTGSDTNIEAKTYQTSETEYAIQVTINPQEGDNDIFHIITPNEFVFKKEDQITFKYQVIPGISGDLTTNKGARYVIYNSLCRYVSQDDPIYLIEESGNENAIAQKMIALATTRGDCVALIDHSNSSVRPLAGEGSIYNLVSTYAKNISGEYAAMFTPWCNISCPSYKPTGTESIDFIMPPSFGYLNAFAKSIKTNASWIAVAGATRGQIPNLSDKKPLNIDKPLTNYIAESVYQNRDGVSINAITNIKPFGYRIWGNRTLKDNSVERNLTATSFLNIRNMVSDIKKVVYNACKKYTFEQNNDILWINFKAEIEPTLDKMKTGAGLSGYKIIKGTTTEKAKLVAVIKLYPLYAVEDFDITVEMLDDEVSVK